MNLTHLVNSIEGIVPFVLRIFNSALGRIGLLTVVAGALIANSFVNSEPNTGDSREEQTPSVAEVTSTVPISSTSSLDASTTTTIGIIIIDFDSCLKQWERAHQETLSGGGSDYQLRMTALECANRNDWAKAAQMVGENIPGLYEAVCLYEPNSIMCRN
jgi:hypothetical protein